MAVQEKFLLTLLKAYEDTELGRKFRLSEIKTIEQFRDRVPILPYSSYESYTKRIARGEQNILTPDPVVHISLTSGSTGKSKMVPVTRRYQNSLGKSNMAAIGFALEALRSQNQQDPSRKLQLGKMLLTNSALLQGYTSGGIDYDPVTVNSIRTGKQLYQATLATESRCLSSRG